MKILTKELQYNCYCYTTTICHDYEGPPWI